MYFCGFYKNKKGMKKSLKITGIAVGGILGLILLVLLFVSLAGGSIAKGYVNKHGEELIGRQVWVEHVGLNLFSGHVAIHNLSVYEEDGKTRFAGFDTLDVSVRLLALMSKKIQVNHFTLAGLDVNILQNGSEFNFSSMIDNFSSEDTVQELKETGPMEWIIDLHQIRLRNGNVAYSDIPRGSHWGLRHLNLIVPDFCIGGTEATSGGLSLQLADGGHLMVNLIFNSSSNDFEAKLNMEQFLLNQLQPYLTDFAYIDEVGGRLNLHLNMAGNLDRIMQMQIGGDISIEELSLIDNQQRSVASLGRLGIVVNEVNLEANRYDIASVALDRLTAAYHDYGDHNTLTDLLKPQTDENTPPVTAAQPETKDTVAEKPMDLRLGHFELTNSTLTYADHTLPEDFVFPISQLNIKAEKVSLSGENNATIRASLPNGGHASIRWNGNISDWKKKQHLNLRIKNLHLTEFNPYMLAYMGQPFKDGTFSFVSDNRINNSDLKGQNQVDIYKASVDKRRKDVDAKMHLPLKAALYVLKDKDEKILLDVPISGNIDQPEFSYMKLVWKTLGNLLVKVVTSPMRAIGNALKSDADGNVMLPIENAAVPDFSSEQFYEIDRVAEMAKQDESIRLVFEQQMTETADSLTLETAERRNRMLQGHLAQLGLDSTQTVITTLTKTGLQTPQYLIKTEVVGLDLDAEE